MARKPLEVPAVRLHLAAVDIPQRITFLTELRTRPAFDGCAILDKIIGDYRRALANARGDDQ